MRTVIRRVIELDDIEYIIEGDTEEFKDCLIYCCGKDKHGAEEVLSRMLTNPTENDKTLIKGHKNLRIAEVAKDKCWWNGYLD